VTDILQKLKSIKVFGVDVDGTLTDGTYHIDEAGHISKSFYTRDFYALNRLSQSGFTVLIITSAKDKVIEAKCAGFDFLLYTGVQKKEEDIGRVLGKMKLKWDNLAFIGDAENDLEVMRLAGFTGCPLDAIPEVVEAANYQSVQSGGRGVVYDFVRKFYSFVGLDW